jgi:outer membrane lipoprotein SlyB
MNTVNSSIRGKSSVDRRPAILYPLMVIAAIAVIIFSVAGIATMMGWLPTVHSQAEPAAQNESTAQSEAPARPAPPTRSAADQPRTASFTAGTCGDCGVIETIRAVESRGQGTGLGAIGGAVVGGILGNQVGRGGGRTAATVVGAGAGAYAGNEVEKNTRTSVSYQVRVRMDDGSIRTFYERSQPVMAIGQKVRVNGREIVAG